jgi:hypothetical protein
MEMLDIRDALARIRLEFTQMPELRINRGQLCRLLSLPPDTCEVALGALVHSGFLDRGPEGKFCRRAVARPSSQDPAPARRASSDLPN